MPVEFSNVPEDEQEKENALIEKKVNAIANIKFLKDLEKLEELKAKFAIKEAEVKKELKELFEENGIKSFSNDKIEITYVAPYMKEGVNTDKLKKDKLYDEYKKQVAVKGSIKIKVKYD